MAEEDWRFKHTWSWYQEHVKYRTSMLNYLLVSVGILANAYVNLLREKNTVMAGWLAGVAALISFAFLCLDVIWLTKIQVAKVALRTLAAEAGGPADTAASLAFKMVLDSESRPMGKLTRALRLHKDRLWTFVIEATLTLAAVLALADAWQWSNLRRGIAVGVVVAFFVPVFLASFKSWPSTFAIKPSPNSCGTDRREPDSANTEKS